MEEPIAGIPFIIGAILPVSLSLMSFWYWYNEDASAARGWSALSVLLVTPVFCIITVPLRWGDLGDGPASGLPIFMALIEAFWIVCGAIVCVLFFHGPVSAFFRKRRESCKVDPEVFE